MRRTIISISCVFVAVVLICVFSLMFVESAISHTESYLTQSLERADQGSVDEAKEYLIQMAEYWHKNLSLLEAVTSHEDLHIATENITEARISLDRDSLDDYYKAMTMLREAIEHIRTQEAISWSNIF